MPKPLSMTSVQTCRLLAPERRNSTPSFQVAIPPVAEMAKPGWRRAMSETALRAMGRTAEPE
ncbi:hypothetical protein D3C72_2343840 [compost metagenome]